MNASQDLAALSQEARALVDEAIAIIEANVQLGDGTVQVSGAGSEGPVIGAANRLEEALVLHPESSVLRYAHCSALAIAGSEDGATPPDLVRETAELIPGAEFHLIRGAGHLPCVEAPEAYAARLALFLERVGHAQGGGGQDHGEHHHHHHHHGHGH